MATRRRDENPTQRGATPAGGARKARKKPKASASPHPTPSSTPKPRSGPIPTPYLALAPTPISSLSPSAIDQLASTSSLILPSSYVRSNSNRGQSRDAQGQGQERRPSSGIGLDAGPSRLENGVESGHAAAEAGGTGTNGPLAGRPAPGANGRAKYVTNLLSPPAIIPGGTSSTPRIQPQPPANPRRRSGERDRDRERERGGPRTRRSEERLRDLVNVNASLTSLGQLGRILESDPTATAQDRDDEQEAALAQAREAVQQAGRRRRRIVRGENGGPVRRLTVSSREEGRAIGLARGASMRRTNVWDDIPEAGEPPPPFPFPTSSTNRLPPAFATSRLTNPSQSDTDRPRSPPPSFEVAIGLIPFVRPASAPAPSTDPAVRSATPPTPRPTRPALSLSTSEQAPAQGTLVPPSPTISPGSTHYASAPSSPTQTVLGSTADLPTVSSLSLLESTSTQIRDDRREWNEDLLAGYTLEERVHREMERRMQREVRQSSRRSSAHNALSTQEGAASAASASISSEDTEFADTGGISLSDRGFAAALVPESGISQVADVGVDESPAVPSIEVETASSPIADRAASSPSTPGPPTAIEGTGPAPAALTDDTASSPLPTDQECSPQAGEEDLAQMDDGEEVHERAPASALPTDNSQKEAPPSRDAHFSPPAASRSEKALPSVPEAPKAAAEALAQPAGRSDTPEIPADDPTHETPEAVSRRSESAQSALPKPDQSSVQPDHKSATGQNPAVSVSPTDPAHVTADIQPKTKSKSRMPPSRSSSLDPSVPPKAPAVETKRLSVPNIDAGRASTRTEADDSTMSNRATRGPLFKGYSFANSPEFKLRTELGTPLSVNSSIQKPVYSEGENPSAIAEKAQSKEMLPPNREAALRRRNLQSTSPMPPAASALVKPSAPIVRPKTAPNKRSTPISGPLISFDTPSPSPPSTPKRSRSQPGPQTQERSPYHDIPALAASSAELLALLEDGFLVDDEDRSHGDKGWDWTGARSNQAESSAMGAKRMEAIASISPPLLSAAPTSPALQSPSRPAEKSTPTLRRVPPPFAKRDELSPKAKAKSAALQGGPGDHPEGKVESVQPSSSIDDQSRQPKAVATRRPPPPPPRPRPVLSLQQPPPLPPRRGDSPDNTNKPTPKRTTSASTTSNSTIVPSPSKRHDAGEPIGGETLNTTSPPVAMTTRPKGPRPPPPPPRRRLTSWFRSPTVTKDKDVQLALASSSATSPAKRTSPLTTAIISGPTLMLRPPNERAQSELPRLVPPHHKGVESEDDDTGMEMDRNGVQGSERGVNRSASAVNLREANPAFPSSSPSTSKIGLEEETSQVLGDISDEASREADESGSQQQQSATPADARTSSQTSRREWTDLDLLAARIEGSGREFEGFTQITSFLGPSKTPGATPAALSTLLPGLINVDSRRTTPQGRVKLKLSLLGLRVSKCPICLSQFKGGEKAVMLPMCSHVGHENCARRWFRESARCWVCREVLPEE
ncbi:hypothetical protein IAU59_002627 [Kwoniella sp. CBS 9459]